MKNKDLKNIVIIEGGICAVDEIKTSGIRKGKYGVMVILCENSVATGVFTSNKVKAAPIIHTQEIIKNGKLSGIIANSGNANCFTGNSGIIDCQSMVETVSKRLNIPKDEIATASTGIIGRKMPMDIITPIIDEVINSLENSITASNNAAKAIMTTDTVPKEFSIEVKLLNGNKVRIGGICKGTGMIAPNMGTMLCFIATDGKANSDDLNTALKIAVNKSFNMLVVDGDESTNDEVILIANGQSNNEITTNGVIDSNFQEGLNFLTQELAKKMAYDGEGATKFLEVEVNGSKSEKDAELIAKSVIKSSLVKTAIFGEDPNWGRIVAAIGYSNAEFNPDNVSIAIYSNGVSIDLVKNGEILAFEGSSNLKEGETLMKNKEIKIIINLHSGEESAIAYGCDLSYDYVKINAEYTT
jgi:glutamate N-acetyltransferase/amino-acid N-acetyltransferase